MRSIYVSIKPEYTKKIVSGEKNYEFRNYYPKDKIDRLYVYETVPTKELKYIIDLGDIVEKPNKISKEGYGNKEFNAGIKTRYAYEIKHLYILDKPILLSELEEKYGFVPPQAYAYDSRYLDLTNYMEKSVNHKIY